MAKTKSYIDNGSGEIKLVAPTSGTVYSIPILSLVIDAVTPNDSTDLDTPAVIFVGTGGTIKINTPENATGVTMTVPDGYEIKGLVTRVWATGTSATNIIAYK